VAFAYTFQVDADSEIVVQVQDASGNVTTKTLTADYTVSGAGNAAGGTVTFVTAPAATDTIAITRSIDIEQPVDLQNRGSVAPEVLEELFDDFTRIIQTLDEEVSRSVKVNVFDTSDIDQLLLDIEVLSGISGNISTVAGIAGNVTTVAGISANVTTVAGIAANVTTVAGVSAAVTTVAGIDTEVAAVAAVAADVADVAAIDTAVAAVALIDAAVSTVAGISGNVTTVAGIASNVTTVAGISTDVSAVAAIDTEIGTVAGDSADIQTLAAISADIQALAAGTGGTLTGNWTASGEWDFTANTALRIPVGTTGQRPGTPAQGDFRYNTTTGDAEIYDGSVWAGVGGGAGLFKGENGEVGSSAGDIFRVNEQTLNTNVTIDANENASAAGPLTVASGVTLTVTSGGNLSIV